MRSGARITALALLLALLGGCAHHRKVTAPPPVAQAPTRPPTEMSTLASPLPPPVPAAAERPLKLDAAPPPEPAPSTQPAPRRKTRRHPKPSAQETAAQQEAQRPAQAASQNATQNNPPQNADIAASGQPSEMSPIGQLSTTNDTANTADRHNIATQIDQTENRLNAIKRAFSSDEQKTVAQIRTFIVRARDALKADDLDGARTLSTKAKLLLQELTKD